MNAPRPPLSPLEDALALMLAQARPLHPAETIATWDADGRVLAQPVVSALHVPPVDNSAMDGYALRAADVPAAGTVLPVPQRIAAGQGGAPLAAGTAARIFTGAPIPAGADAVVMQEECEALADGAQVRIHRVPQAGQSVRRAGEDVARGATVLQPGLRLGPAALGLAASVGVAQLAVAPRPHVALFSTGDELVMPGDVAPEQMRPGAIFNSNRFVLRALLQRLGCVVHDHGIVPDRLDATVQALRTAAADCDLILTSGGVSVGEEDHLRPAVHSLGRVDLWQLAIKPGKPFAYGQVVRADGSSAHFMGLPGNPVASLVTCLLLVRPFVQVLQGVAATGELPHMLLPAHFELPRSDKRREFLRARRNAQGGLDLYLNQSSGVLTSTVWADGLIDHPAGHTIARGGLVRFIPFAELLA